MCSYSELRADVAKHQDRRNVLASRAGPEMREREFHHTKDIILVFF